MKVLMITGDKRFGPGNPRFEAQAAAVEQLSVLYWGRGAAWPRIPRGHFDVVTAQDPFFRGHLAGHIAWLKGARLKIQVHADLDIQPWWRHAFAQIQLRHADSVRVVSEKIKAQVLRMAPKARVSVLPVYVELEKFKKVVPVPHAQKTILWVGRFEEEKNPLQAIEVLKEVRAGGVDAKLVMLGAGTLEKPLRAAAARRNLAAQVEFAGWQDPAGYLAASDVVLSTSHAESWGESIVEALAAGVPVVAPDVGIASEAGATVVPRAELAQATIDALRSGARGVLRLRLPTKEEWITQWIQTL